MNAPDPIKALKDAYAPFIAFDVDDTLIDELDQPRWDVIGILRWFHSQGHPIIVWSGGGAEYAALWGRRLYLPSPIMYREKPDPCAFPKVAIAFDDQAVTFGTVNIQVRRQKGASS